MLLQKSLFGVENAISREIGRIVTMANFFGDKRAIRKYPLVSLSNAPKFVVETPTAITSHLLFKRTLKVNGDSQKEQVI